MCCDFYIYKIIIIAFIIYLCKFKTGIIMRNQNKYILKNFKKIFDGNNKRLDIKMPRFFLTFYIPVRNILA